MYYSNKSQTETMATSEEFQDIAEQRAILESIRLYESDRQLSDAIKRSMGMENQSKKAVAPKQADPEPTSESSDSDDDEKDMFANEIKFSSDEDAADAESDDEIKLELPKKKQAPADGLKEIKDKLRAEIIAELKAEEAKKTTKKPTKK
jgi:hypothetical protein